LTRKNTFYCRYGVFKVRMDRRPREDPPASPKVGARSLKTQQRGRRARRIPGECRTLDGPRAIESPPASSPEGLPPGGGQQACTPAGVNRSGIP
jgi:hypothetical protein